MNTKERIRSTAIRLFNENGYDKVSLREIAKESETSLGNVTHHFGKKEDLLLSLLTDLHEQFTVNFSVDLSQTQLLEELVVSFINAEKNRERFPFYYKNMSELSSASEALRDRIYAFQKKLYDFYLLSFRLLQAEGFIYDYISLEGLQSLAYMYVSIGVSWSTPNSPNSNPQIQNNNYSKLCCDLLEVYLHSGYRNLVREMYKNKKTED